MDWGALIDIVVIPLAFIVGRYSRRYEVLRVRRRYKQDVGDFIRGR
jgi:hypothetical protein